MRIRAVFDLFVRDIGGGHSLVCGAEIILRAQRTFHSSDLAARDADPSMDRAGCRGGRLARAVEWLFRDRFGSSRHNQPVRWRIPLRDEGDSSAAREERVTQTKALRRLRLAPQMSPGGMRGHDEDEPRSSNARAAEPRGAHAAPTHEGFAFTHDPLLGTIACHRGDDSQRVRALEQKGDSAALERYGDTTGFDPRRGVFYAGTNDADAEAHLCGNRDAAWGDLDTDGGRIEPERECTR